MNKLVIVVTAVTIAAAAPFAAVAAGSPARPVPNAAGSKPGVGSGTDDGGRPRPSTTTKPK